MSEPDPFSPSEFDPWAATYDEDVVTQNQFPFLGYKEALQTVVQAAAPSSGMSVLDVGTGTGNLALLLARRGCELWCTDFSEGMLAKARKKLPEAHFVLHDLRAALPAELDRGFDRIVSAYVFHHFELDRKVELCRELATGHLTQGGKLIIADLSFQDGQDMLTFAESVGDLWEQEPYWLTDESVRALRGAGLTVEYRQVSACAGVYTITA
jgi:ubiquinone/menaquinone biosynthesis C-methylase UbiE